MDHTSAMSYSLLVIILYVFLYFLIWALSHIIFSQNGGPFKAIPAAAISLSFGVGAWIIFVILFGRSTGHYGMSLLYMIMSYRLLSKWAEEDNNEYTCTDCGSKVRLDDDVCPNCGAIMEDE